MQTHFQKPTSTLSPYNQISTLSPTIPISKKKKKKTLQNFQNFLSSLSLWPPKIFICSLHSKPLTPQNPNLSLLPTFPNQNRSKFSEAEAMAIADSRDQALSLLTAANNHADLVVKLSSLKQAKDILSSLDSSSAAELFPYLADLQRSPQSLVRKFLVE